MNIGEWRFSFEIAWDDPWYKWQSVITILLFLFGTTHLLWKLIPVGLENGLIVYHYNLYLGIDVVDHWIWLNVLPLVVLAIIFANLIASFRFYRHDKILSRMLLCSATVFVILIYIGAYFIASVNA